MKVQKAVMDETKRIAIGVLLLAVLMIIVFTVLGRFDLSVIYGAVIGCLIAISNFFFLGLSLQKATLKKEDELRNFVKSSYSGRMIFIFIILAFLLYFGFCNPAALLIPLIFPRMVIAVMSIAGISKDKSQNEEEA